MDDSIKDKLAKVYALVQQGTDGEKQAAKAALDRLMKKYNISEEYVKSMNVRFYKFTYSLELDKWLMSRLITYLLRKDNVTAYLDTDRQRAIVLKLEYLDWVTLECAYDYFRKHMRGEYKRLVTPQLNRCRTARTKREKKKQLDDIFFSKYVIASKLYDENELKTVNWSDMTETERKQRTSLDGVQGGSYNTQVSTGLYLG